MIGLNLKGAAYADDISVICQNNVSSIQSVFSEYERLTKRSGLELNADKTEILILNKKRTETKRIKYNNNNFDIKTISKMKICGLYYCLNKEEEYKLNVLDKITKLSYKIKMWTPRHLTLEGKTLIVKTFGLSQIIYNMQAYEFGMAEIVMIERTIFKFLWSTANNPNGIDRIKRSIMKNEFPKGGMKVTDVECLNRSLKLKQFIRAHNSNHVISRIQAMLSTRNGEGKHLRQEYSEITEDEPVCRVAQETLNMITDNNRIEYDNLTDEYIETDKHLINEVASTNLAEYLRRKKHVFMLCMAKPLLNNGIETLGELTQAYEYETDNKTIKTMKLVMSTFSSKMIQISKSFINDINSIEENLKYILLEGKERKDVNIITVKEMQLTLKRVLHKIEDCDFETKLGVAHFEEENITNFRLNCKNSKLRNIYFRLIHNDFFTHVRMKKYKMSQVDTCPRCGITETSKHLLWECEHARKIWKLYNEVIEDEEVITYEDIFKFDHKDGTITIKIKIIQELIQIDRPKNWNKCKIINIIVNLMNIEKYNATKLGSLPNFNKKWKKYHKLTLIT